jgi:hypothetical protein
MLHEEWIFNERSHAGIIVARQQRYSSGEELRGLARLAAADIG